MKVVILGLNKKRKTGIETWKDNLIIGLSKKNEVREIYTKNWANILVNLSFIFSADISHSYSQSTGTVFIMLVRKLLDKMNVHTVHGNYYAEQESKIGIKKIFWIPFNKFCTFLADKITFPSKYLYFEITNKEPYLKKKSVIIPNGIDLKKIGAVNGYTKKKMELKDDDFLIIEVTNFNLKQKAAGIDMLIKDFNNFNKKVKNSYLFIIGGGILLESYKQKYESNKIKFLGFQKNVIKYIKGCDLFVHYSFLDSFGYVILEALACKKPVIALGSPAFNEILRVKKNGLNISSNRKSFKILLDKEKGIINNYSIENITKKFILVYKNLENGKK